MDFRDNFFAQHQAIKVYCPGTPPLSSTFYKVHSPAHVHCSMTWRMLTRLTIVRYYQLVKNNHEKKNCLVLKTMKY